MIIIKLLFMNKMLQIWKFFITETNSHHTIQILKSFYFIFVQYVTKFAKSCKNHDFYYEFIRNFVQFFFSNECAILCKPCSVLIENDAKFRAKSLFVQKRAREPAVLWKS